MSASAKSGGAKRLFVAIYCIAIAVVSFGPSVASAEPRFAAVSRSHAPAALSSALSASPRFFVINQVLASHDAQARNGSAVRLASIDPSAIAKDSPKALVRPSERRGEPFGLLTFRAPEGLLWIKWRKLELELGADARAISDCRADPDQCTSPAALRFLALLDSVRELPLRARIGNLNRAINHSIRYVSDLKQHGVLDSWSSPLATWTSGQGDCEDYAIAKYLALRDLGVGKADLRLVLVRDRAVGQDHAVLAVRYHDRWLALDNRHSQLLDVAEVPQFMPLFAIDHQGVKLFARSYAGTPARGDQMAPAASDDYW
jgi:predicted transglutaminase-like cysteine proteinase